MSSPVTRQITLRTDHASHRSRFAQITLRIPVALYEQVRQVAQARRTSVNKLAQEEFERLARTELFSRVDAAYEALADDADTDAEPFFEAQREEVWSGSLDRNERP